MGGVAYAVVRDDPPLVFLAEDVDVLQRVLAVELVARTDPTVLSATERDALRAALMEERWADAVIAWIERLGVEVDVYTHLHVFGSGELPEDLIGAQLQFSPLFRDG